MRIVCFHAAVVGLAGNRQLDIALEPILLKLQLPMAMNIRAEARHRSAHDGIDRHQAILTALDDQRSVGRHRGAE